MELGKAIFILTITCIECTRNIIDHHFKRTSLIPIRALNSTKCGRKIEFAHGFDQTSSISQHTTRNRHFSLNNYNCQSLDQFNARLVCSRRITVVSAGEYLQKRSYGFMPADQVLQVQERDFERYSDQVTSRTSQPKIESYARKFASPTQLQQFGRLPAELRLMIFRNLLRSEQPLEWCFRKGRPNFSFKPNMLIVCQTW